MRLKELDVDSEQTTTDEKVVHYDDSYYLKCLKRKAL